MIKVYTVNGCARCQAIKKHLEEKGIEHVVINVDELSPEIKEFLINGAKEAGVKNFPIVKRGDEIITYTGAWQSLAEKLGVTE